MCGIAGILRFEGKVFPDEIQKMNSALKHRGPDGEGVWLNDQGSIGLGHRRLAIVDLSEKANQPMHSEDGNLSITFNGEIYNYIELRESLIKKGCQFFSDSDTEVLLLMFEHYKEKMLEMLDGMFAFAIWDNREQRLFCARDRFGEKPFFFHFNERGFYFGSEMKALFAVGVPLQIDPFMISNFLLTDLVVNPEDEKQTFYKGIQKLPKGSSLSIDVKGKIEIEKYYQINLNQNNISLEEAQSKLKELLTKSVSRRLRSDVPVSSSVSGGLDSAIIERLTNAGLKNSNSSFENVSFSARFNEPGYSENKYLDEIIQSGNTKNFSVYPDYKLISEHFYKIFYHQEEPFWSASMLNHFALMQLVASHKVVVVLEGQGADELFAGYTWHRRIFLQELYKISRKKYKEEVKNYSKSDRVDFYGKLKTISPKLTFALHKIRSRNGFAKSSKKEWKKIISSELADIDKLGSYYIKPNKPDLNDMLYMDLNCYYLESLLRVGDRNSMAFAREVRLPFLDHKLVDFAFSLPSDLKIKNGWQKFILRKTFEEIIPSSITWRKDKIGFAAPQDKWMNEPENQQLIKKAISSLKENGWINSESEIPPKFYWKILMLYSLFNFSKIDFSKC